MSSKKQLFGRVSDYFFLAAGPVIAATAAALFYTPARITGGGATGVGTIFYYLFGFDQGIVMMCVNVPLILLGMKVFGWRYGIKTLIGSTLLSIWTTIIGRMTAYSGVLDTSDDINILLSAIYGGVLMGVGIGLTMKSGCNTGGTDIVAQVIAHYFPVSVGSVEFVFNAVVVSCGGIFLGLQPMLFAIIAMYLSSQLVNFVVMNFGTKLAKSVYIDWGAFIMAVITFLLTALVLFFILKALTSVKKGFGTLKSEAEMLYSADYEALKKEGKSKKEIKAILAKRAEEKKAAAEAEAAANAPETTEDLLREIRDLLRARQAAEAKEDEEKAD